MDIRPYLKVMVEQQASDLFITVGFPPCTKVNGEVNKLTEIVFTPEQSLEFIETLMNDKQRKEFHDTKECNFAYAEKNLGRFRVNAFWQRGSAGCVMRRIKTKIPDVDELGLPPILKELVMSKRGIIIVVGGTGTGKSTSVAALVDYRNKHARGHILTIEDPVEFLHKHHQSIITQREVGIDTESFDVGLKSSLRQAPDVILIGEIRSKETMEFALSFAETGHLCIATLHANNANQALDRIMHLAPEGTHKQLLFELSLNLRCFVAQQLINETGTDGRCAAVELLINTPRVASLLAKNELHLLKQTMAKSTEQGMQTFDQALFKLYEDGRISHDDALHHADSKNDLRLMIKLRGRSEKEEDKMSGITIDLG